jgi:two-component system chemotaxis response regulator CheB
VRRDVVVIGGSAGSHQALRQIVERLPADLPAAVLVATHLPPTGPGRLPAVLAKAGALEVEAAVDGRPLRPGRIHTAVPDRHLLIDDHDLLRLGRGPCQNRVRPAVDALFRSAARWCGPRVIGVVLSGSLDDGAGGLAAVVQRGGVALVQDPRDARFDGMPSAARQTVPGATVLPAAQLARAIAELAGWPVQPAADPPSDALIWETDVTARANTKTPQPGRPAGLGCPECSGGMNIVHDGDTLYYVCHTGHSYSPETLIAARDDSVEAALWTALSAMQEKTMVLNDLAARAAAAGDHEGHERHLAAAGRAGHAADLLREQIMTEDPPVGTSR